MGSIPTRHWHRSSPSPVPVRITETGRAWSVRRYNGGFRSGDETFARVPAPRLPRAMLRPKLGAGQELRLSIVSHALSVQKRRGSRQAMDYLIRALGTETAADLSETYFAEAVSYHLALLYAHSSDPEKMAEQITLSHTMPGPDDDLLFSDHVNASRPSNEHQKRAIGRGIPPVLFACMPRSASATMTHILGRVFDIPVVHLCLGRFPNYFLAPSWLDMFLEGGAITQDHIAPNHFNIGVLSGRGSRDIFVLVRDPRAAARSQVHYQALVPVEAQQSLEARIEHECIAHFVPWLQGWWHHSRNPDLPFRIHWLTYQEVSSDPAAVLRKVVRILQRDYPALSAYADCQKVPDIKIHYVTGNDHAWLAEVGDQTRQRMWAACTPEIRSLLALEA